MKNIIGTKYTVILEHGFKDYIVDLEYSFKKSDFSSKTGNYDLFSGRTDDLNSVGVSLTKSMDVGIFDNSSIGIFYRYISNVGKAITYDFEGDQAGIVINLSF